MFISLLTFLLAHSSFYVFPSLAHSFLHPCLAWLVGLLWLRTCLFLPLGQVPPGFSTLPVSLLLFVPHANSSLCSVLFCYVWLFLATKEALARVSCTQRGGKTLPGYVWVLHGQDKWRKNREAAWSRSWYVFYDYYHNSLITCYVLPK